MPAPVTTPQPARAAAETAPTSTQANGTLESSCTGAQSELPDSSRARDARRTELKARFDALSDRLMSVEDGLDTLLRRSAQRDKLERRSDQQSVEMIDNVAVAGERQAAVLEGLLSTVSRLEHGMSRLEHGLSRVERALGERGRRDSHAPAPSQPPRGTSPSQFPESQPAPRDGDGQDVRAERRNRQQALKGLNGARSFSQRDREIRNLARSSGRPKTFDASQAGRPRTRPRLSRPRPSLACTVRHHWLGRGSAHPENSPQRQ
jgi:hypothetical protein